VTVGLGLHTGDGLQPACHEYITFIGDDSLSGERDGLQT
jgi:hypothetical protein